MIVIQQLVVDNPTAQLISAASGVLFAAYVVMVVMFLPRVKDVFTLQEDGVTARNENGSAAPSQMRSGALATE
jgi:hypothetical protein